VGKTIQPSPKKHHHFKKAGIFTDILTIPSHGWCLNQAPCLSHTEAHQHMAHRASEDHHG
jgi:hypothetical protein